MKKKICMAVSYVLCFILAAGVLPPEIPFGIKEAYAEAGGVYLGAGVLSEKVNTGDAAKVCFGNNGGYAWRVVGYNGESPSIPLSEGGEGKITLLADDNIDPLTLFNPDGNDNNHYKDSLLMTSINNIGNYLSPEEIGAVVKRTLKNGGGEDFIAGEQVDDQVLWPLSLKEVKALDESLRRLHPESITDFQCYFWLRSPDNSSNYMAYMVNNDGSDFPHLTSVYVNAYAYGVRPAFNLKLPSVLLTTLISGTPGTAGAEYKLTVLDRKMKLNVNDGKGYFRGLKARIFYSISGDNKDKAKKLSVLMTDGSWSEDSGWSEGAEIKYYSHLDLPGGIGEEGTGFFALPESYDKSWNIYVIAETEGTEKSTVFACAPVKIELIKDKSVTGLGTGSIKDPPDIMGKWDYVYFGNKTGTRYRVLSKSTNDFSGDKSKYTMLLDGDGFIKDDHGSDLSFSFDQNPGSNKWNESDLKSTLNGGSFLNSSDHFTAPERSSIVSSYKPEPASSDGIGSENCSFVPLTGEKIFLLDAKEVTNPTYGYDNNQAVENLEIASRKKSGDYWLRSNVGDSSHVETVLGSGALASYAYDRGIFVSPAFNLDLSSILFSSLVSGSPDTPGAEYNLTLIDKDLKIALPDEDKVTVSGNTCTLTAKTTNDTANGIAANMISVLVTDKEYGTADAAILDYSVLKETSVSNSEYSGYFTLDRNKLSGNVGKDIFIYIIAEMLNDDKETDYASVPLKIDSFNGAHFHRFSYRAEGRTVIAECSVESCTLPGGRISLVLNPPALRTEGGKGSPSATLSGAEDFCRETGLSVQESDIRYEGIGSTNYPESSEAPTKKGSYRAFISLNGCKAYADYTIDPKKEEKDPDDPDDPEDPVNPAPAPPTPKDEAVESVKNGLAARDDTIKLTKRGKKYGLKTDVSGTLSVVKGNKFYLFDIEGKPVFVKNKAVKISKKGKVQAKKEISDYRFSYKDKVNGKNISVSLNVINPFITRGKKLTASTVAGTDFDYSTTIPLNAEFLKVKNKGVADGLIYQGEAAVGEDGRIHIKGRALKKGTVKIPFKVYGKKFTVKLKVKKQAAK